MRREREYLNTAQMAILMQCSTATIYRYAKRKKNPLPTVKLSRNKLLFDLAVVRSWMDEIGGYEELITQEITVGD